jgi:hypothetical protein
MSNYRKPFFDFKLFLKLSVAGSAVVCLVGLGVLTKYSSETKEQLLEQKSGNSFALLECSASNCNSGIYVDLSATKISGVAPQVMNLPSMHLKSISTALLRSNLPYKFNGHLALYEVGKCNNILRDSPETFHALEFAPITESLQSPPYGKTCDEVDNEGPCKMRVRLLDSMQNSPSYQLTSSLNRWSYFGSSFLWAWL